jgi:nucleotide-binding universal stress UspA family protein
MPLSLLQHGQLSIASVVFATDFSPASHTAGLYAAALAKHFHAELIIFHAFLPGQSAREAEANTQKQSVERSVRVHQLEVAAESLRSITEPVRTHLFEGDPSDEIAVFADSLSHALLVLGTHGGGGLERRLIGSVAERSLRRAASPTLTVGPLVPFPDPLQPFHAMLYATDCSDMASRAAPLACAFASSFANELKVINIVDAPAGALPEILADLDFHAHQQIAEQLASQCEFFSEPRALASARAAREEILKYAIQSQSDLLILGVHRRAAIELLDRNSITIQLIARAHCPVLTVTRDSLPEGAS